MKKILYLIIPLFVLLLVSCGDKPPIPGGGKGNTNVLVEDLVKEDNLVTATLNVKLLISKESQLLEVLHDSANLVYNRYKDEIKDRLYTFNFKVILNNEVVGYITYRVNDGIENPGLTYINSDLTIN